MIENEIYEDLKNLDADRSEIIEGLGFLDTDRIDTIRDLEAVAEIEDRPEDIAKIKSESEK